MLQIEERKSYCEDLKKFIENTQNSVKEACEFVGWKQSAIKNPESYITCPFNKGHKVPERTIEKHLQKCEWNVLGYTKDCKSLPESTLSAESPYTMKFDIELQHKVLREAKLKSPQLQIGIEEKLVPQTSDRLFSDFSTDERKAIYEYVVANTIGPDIGQDIVDIDKPERGETSRKNAANLELLILERNLKRRRVKHKGVHTNKKSHTEILRELVQQQMEMYKEYLEFNESKSLIEGNSNGKDSGESLNKHSSNEIKKDDNRLEKELKQYKSDHKTNRNDSCYSKERYSENRVTDYKRSYQSHSYDKDYYRNNSHDRHKNDSSYHKKSSHKKDDNYYKSYSRKRSRSRSNENIRVGKREHLKTSEASSYSKRRRSKSYESEISKETKLYVSKDESIHKHIVISSTKTYQSESREIKCDEKSRYDSKERESHKKHKKDHKKSKRKSPESHNHSDKHDKKHKKSKKKHHKHRSRSKSKD